MLETVRAYAEEQLASGNEETVVRRRHAAFFLDRAEDTAPRLAGQEHATWSELLESEHANLRAALDFALRTGDDASALRFGAALWRFWLERGYFAEGRAWLRLALSRDGDPELRARALTGASVLAHYAGDYEAAEALCRESIELNEARGDEPGRAAALEALALAVRTRGDFAGAVPCSSRRSRPSGRSATTQGWRGRSTDSGSPSGSQAMTTAPKHWSQRVSPRSAGSATEPGSVWSRRIWGFWPSVAGTPAKPSPF